MVAVDQGSQSGKIATSSATRKILIPDGVISSWLISLDLCEVYRVTELIELAPLFLEHVRVIECQFRAR